MKKLIIRPDAASTSTLPGPALHPLLQSIYAQRNISPADIDLSMSLLLSYHNLKGIEQAVDCLVKTLQEQKKLVVIGDFDADGATSTALAVKAMRAFGAKQVSYLVPNRFEYGYGLTPEIVELAKKQQDAEVIITVDNGISSVAGVARAHELQCEVIITDHHLPGAELPKAAAIVNPNQPGCLFPSKNMAGVGVIFYVMLALRSRLRDIGWFSAQNLPEPNMAQFLDLVSLGTIADVVPLDHNNRVLAQQGLLRIRCQPLERWSDRP